jgi:hypothetical protein
MNWESSDSAPARTDCRPAEILPSAILSQAFEALVAISCAHSEVLARGGVGELIAALARGSAFGGIRETDDAWNRLLIVRYGADSQHDA